MADGPPTIPLPGAVRTHLDELTGRLGIYQHARGRTPDPGQGYCTDDVARAALVDILHRRQLGPAAVAPSLERSVAFLAAARVVRTGRLRNFRDDDGNWLESEGSADANARGIQALGSIVAESLDDSVGRLALDEFEALLPAAVGPDGARPWAHAIIGCLAALRSPEPPLLTGPVLGTLAGRLMDAFSPVDADWPWPEPVVTYENAILPQALIEAGTWLGDPAMVEQGLTTLDWLLAAQLAPSGFVDLVGNQGWWPRGQAAARFDQQPIDAAACVEACLAAWRVTDDAHWLVELERAYAWFNGFNSTGRQVADPDRGGCCDGLSPIGPNANQGAESTLAWLSATEHVRMARSQARPGQLEAARPAREESRSEPQGMA
ncbi:MAG: hypothetical protein ACRDGQ_04845 [Candidatus Limnocylindrales bacterium]